MLTALMRLPARTVVGVWLSAVRDGPRGWEGLMRSVPDVPAALHRRRTIPERIRTDLRRLAGPAR
jgi:hypothetical protein